jgi:hypothetical protein
VNKGLHLDRVVLLGRTFEEYARYFALSPETLVGRRILDVAGGVSSFCSEAGERGWNVTALDPIYSLPAAELQPRCANDLDHVVRAIDGLTVYRWDFYKSPVRMRAFRERAYRTFLDDFKNAPVGRYVEGSLPRTPFADGQFDLALVSYFLFVYQDQFPYEFHRDAIIELARVTSGEVRIYPTVTFEAERSVYLDRLIADPMLDHLRFEEVRTDFEFLLNSNSFLRITRRQTAG